MNRNDVSGPTIARVIRDWKRELLRERMDRQNIATTGDAGSIDTFLESSKDNVDFEFSIAGIAVHVYIFMETMKGSITVDSSFFESFEFTAGSWDTIIPEVLVSFVNTGFFRYVGDDITGDDVEEKIMQPGKDMIITFPVTPSMAVRPVARLLSGDGRCIPVIVRSHSLERLQGVLAWFSPGTLAGIVTAIHGRMFRDGSDDV